MRCLECAFNRLFFIVSPWFSLFFHSGISLAQDSRFKSADKKLLAKMNFAPELDQKVDLNKVEIGILRAARAVARSTRLHPQRLADAIVLQSHFESGSRSA
jgi:hypothetical protein